MVKFYTLKELSEKLNMAYTTITTLSRNKHFKSFFAIENILVKYNSPKGTYFKQHPLKVIPVSKIEDFKEEYNQWQKRAKRPIGAVRGFWTRASVECYDNGMKCSDNCPNFFICKSFEAPPIKDEVERLVNKFGYPNEYIKERLMRE